MDDLKERVAEDRRFDIAVLRCEPRYAIGSGVVLC
jgi:hypothetical protein